MRWLILFAFVLAVAWLVGRMRGQGSRAAPPVGRIKGPGQFRFDIVGESHYQKALARIAGPKTEEGVDHGCVAVLVLDDSNQYDDKAVRVDIDGETVGHLSRDHARQWHKELARQNLPNAQLSVAARIVGGWNRGDGDTGHYGVKLDLPLVD